MNVTLEHNGMGRRYNAMRSIIALSAVAMYLGGYQVKRWTTLLHRVRVDIDEIVT